LREVCPTLATRGDVKVAQGRPDDAATDWRTALALFRALRAPEAEQLASRVAGTNMLAAGRGG
jgi:hypothetical protein